MGKSAKSKQAAVKTGIRATKTATKTATKKVGTAPKPSSNGQNPKSRSKDRSKDRPVFKSKRVRFAIVPNHRKNTWDLQRDGKVISSHQLKPDAEKAAREAVYAVVAKAGWAQIVLHNWKGRIQREYSYPKYSDPQRYGS